MTHEQAARALRGELDFQRGQVVKIVGERGRFKVCGYGRDGSLTLWGGPTGQESFRSVMPSRLRRATGTVGGVPNGRAPERKRGQR